MAANKADLIRLLEAELDLIEGGGYGLRAGHPPEERPMFSDSLACINHWLVPGHDKGCEQDCALMQWVPERNKQEELPCHFIPLNSAGQTVQSFAGNQALLEEAVKKWLRDQIRQLRSGDATLPGGPEVKY
jgi:hypothetical protein